MFFTFGIHEVLIGSENWYEFGTWNLCEAIILWYILLLQLPLKDQFYGLFFKNYFYHNFWGNFLSYCSFFLRRTKNILRICNFFSNSFLNRKKRWLTAILDSAFRPIFGCLPFFFRKSIKKNYSKHITIYWSVLLAIYFYYYYYCFSSLQRAIFFSQNNPKSCSVAWTYFSIWVQMNWRNTVRVAKWYFLSIISNAMPNIYTVRNFRKLFCDFFDVFASIAFKLLLTLFSYQRRFLHGVIFLTIVKVLQVIILIYVYIYVYCIVV